MKVKMTSNWDSAAQNFDNFAKQLSQKIVQAADKPLNLVLQKFRSDFKQIITKQTLKAKNDPSIPKEVENVGMTSATLLKAITGEDLLLSQVYQSKKDGMFYQKNDASNIFAVRNGHVGMSQTLDASTTYEGFINKVMERFSNGVYVDPKTGKAFIIPEDAEQDLRDAVKIECSTKHLDHPDSKKAFYRWQNSLMKKYGGKPGKYINARMFKDGLEKIMRKAKPLDPVVDALLVGDTKQAKDIINTIGAAKFKKVTENIDKVMEGKAEQPDAQALAGLIKITKNVRVVKKKIKNKVQYSLISSYSAEGPGVEEVLTEIERQLLLALPDIGNEIYKAIVIAAEDTIRQYMGN